MPEGRCLKQHLDWALEASLGMPVTVHQLQSLGKPFPFSELCFPQLTLRNLSVPASSLTILVTRMSREGPHRQSMWGWESCFAVTNQGKMLVGADSLPRKVCFLGWLLFLHVVLSFLWPNTLLCLGPEHPLNSAGIWAGSPPQ